MSQAGPLRILFWTAGLVVAMLLVWKLKGVILMVLGVVIAATILRSLSGIIQRYVRLSSGWALTLTVLLIVALFAVFAAVLGTQVWLQAAVLVHTLPRLLDNLASNLGIPHLSQILAHGWTVLGQGDGLKNVAGYTTHAINAVINIFLLFISSIYMAMEPELYWHGALQLWPQPIRNRLAVAGAEAITALRLWLLGQLVSMLSVGILTTLGLILIGMPLPLVLGLVMGLAEFVPVIGPLVSAIPAILIAVPHGGGMVLSVIALYVMVQQLEGHLITPLVQKKAVNLPPVVTLFAMLVAEVLFGPAGILLATPMAVLAFVAVKQLYVRDILSEPTPIPGEKKARRR